MRKLNRLPEPEVLQQNSNKWNKQWTALRENNASADFSWYKFEGRSVREHILPKLREQTQCHCSFCDAFPLDGVSNETIEHFRPKSKFPQLAYTWLNLFYCCDSCQSCKRENWDELLLNPDADDYQFDRYFEFDFTKGEIKPNALASEEDQKKASTTIRLYGLNNPARQRNRRNEARKWGNQEASQNEPHLWAYRDYLGIV